MCSFQHSNTALVVAFVNLATAPGGIQHVGILEPEDIIISEVEGGCVVSAGRRESIDVGFPEGLFSLKILSHQIKITDGLAILISGLLFSFSLFFVFVAPLIVIGGW